MKKIRYLIDKSEIENLEEKIKVYQNKGYDIELQKVWYSWVRVGDMLEIVCNVKTLASFLLQFYNPNNFSMIKLEEEIKQAIDKPFSAIRSYEEA